MIGYVLLSYVIVLLIIIKLYFFDFADGKSCFKAFLVSPIYLPIWIVTAYINW